MRRSPSMRLGPPDVLCRSRRLLARCLAMLLLAAIAPALVDAGCDPLFTAAQADVLTDASQSDGGGDACDDGCVPDCFSCCPTLGASDVVRLDVPRDVTSVATPAPTRQGGGAPRVPEPVPKPTS